LSTYIDIYDDYKHHCFALQESYYNWYKKASNLESAVTKAFHSKNENGKLHSHQRRVGHKRLAKAARIALGYLNNNSKVIFDNFDRIHDFVKQIAKDVEGFGDLASYDISVRIAQYLNCEIKEVHLHAGVTDGVKAMGFKARDGQTMSIDQFPHPFNQLSADHLENLLCIYKDDLAKIYRGE
jgi:hypothetical protein